jgi:hypothetical protein
MATATNTGSPTWRANNVNRPAGAGRKWDEEMRQRIVSEVQKADAAGLPRARVFAELAQEWSSSRTGICRGEHYTEHQVASQFHLSKERLGYEVPAQIQRMPHTAPRKLGKGSRALLAPPTKSNTKTLAQANRTIDALRLKLAQKDARIKVLRAQRNDALAELKELRRELAS